MNILIVEDNEINARVLGLMLKSLSFDVATDFAENAEEALSVTSQRQFDLVLMDINLGDGQKTGTEVMQILKEKGPYQSVPIYAVTCYSLPGDKEKFLKAGFDKYISKPIDKDFLLQEIENEKTTTHE